MFKKNSATITPKSKAETIKLTELIEKLQKSADKVEINILETEQNLDRDVGKIKEGKQPLYQEYTNKRILNLLELLKALDEDIAAAKRLHYPQAEEIEQDVNNLREGVKSLRENHDKIYHQTRGQELTQTSEAAESELIVLHKKLQKSADEVEKNIQETEQNLNRDVGKIKEGKQPLYQEYTNKRILNSLELLKAWDEYTADLKRLHHPQAEVIEQDLNGLRDRVRRMREDHDKIYHQTPGEGIPTVNWGKSVDEKLGQIVEGGRYTLLRNKGNEWDIKDQAGTTLTAPGVCFFISPTDPESVSNAENLVDQQSKVNRNPLAVLKKKNSAGRWALFKRASSATGQDEPPTSPARQGPAVDSLLQEEQPSTSSATQSQASSGMLSTPQDELPSMSSATCMSPEISDIEDEDLFASRPTSPQHEPSETPGAELSLSPTEDEPLSTDPANWPSPLTDRIRTELVRKGPNSSPSVPPAVTQVIVTTRSDTHIEIEWTKVNNINTYILKSSDGTETLITGSAGNQVTLTVTSLSAGTEYSFTLFTVFEEVRSKGYVFSAVTVPPAVTQVDVTSRSDTHIEIEWTKVNDINTYILKLSDETETLITGSAGNKVTHIVSSLSTGTEYSFTLFTMFKEVRSTGYVFSAVTVPPAVTQVIVTTRSDTHIEIEWTKVNNINTYILKLSDETEIPITGSAGNKVALCVTSLSAGTEYSFTLFTVFEEVRSAGYVFSAVTEAAAVPSQASSESRTKYVLECGEHFIDKYRVQLIESITTVEPMLDRLLAKNVISHENYTLIRTKSTSTQIMRELFELGSIHSTTKGKDCLYDVLMELEQFIMDDLRERCFTEAQGALQSPEPELP